jgi:hypothetical protein
MEPSLGYVGPATPAAQHAVHAQWHMPAACDLLAAGQAAASYACGVHDHALGYGGCGMQCDSAELSQRSDGGELRLAECDGCALQVGTGRPCQRFHPSH